jgi:hypothetical protein
MFGLVGGPQRKTKILQGQSVKEYISYIKKKYIEIILHIIMIGDGRRIYDIVLYLPFIGLIVLTLDGNQIKLI